MPFKALPRSWLSAFREHPFLIVPFAFYAYTCCPAIALGDPALLIDAIKSLILSTHVNNHNITILAGWLFQFLPFGEIAYRANLADAFIGACTVALFYDLSFRISGSKLPAVVSSLFLMISHTLWWNSTISEVYAANALFTVLALRLFYQIGQKEDNEKDFYFLFFVSGLSVFNHVIMGLWVLSAVAALLWRALERREFSWRFAAFCGLSLGLGGLPYFLTFLKDLLLNGGNFGQTLSIALFGSFKAEMLKTPFSWAALWDSLEFYLLQVPSLYLLVVILGLGKFLRDWPSAVKTGILTAFGINFWLYTFVLSAWDKFCGLLPSFIIFLLWGAGGTAGIIEFLKAKKRKGLNFLAAAAFLLSFIWTVYFYHHASRWALDPASYLYRKWNNAYTANTHRVNEYLLNPDKRHYTDIRDFCELLFSKLPPHSIFFDSDSRTYHPLTLYYQKLYHKRPDLQVELMNSWGFAGWGSSRDQFFQKLENAYQNDQPLFLISLAHPFHAALQERQGRYRFKTFPLDSTRYIYKLVTAHEGMDHSNLFERWDEVDTSRRILIDLRMTNILYTEGGTALRQDMAAFGPSWRNDDQVFFMAQAAGAELGVLLRAGTAGSRNLGFVFTTAPDYGIYDIYLNAAKIGSVDLYSKTVSPLSLELKEISLEKGNHVLRFREAGRNPAAEDSKMGIDTLEIAGKGAEAPLFTPVQES